MVLESRKKDKIQGIRENTVGYSGKTWDLLFPLTKEVNSFPNFICLKTLSILLSLENFFQFFYTLENRSGCTVKILLEKRVEEYVQQRSFIIKTFNLLKTDLEHSFLNLNARMLHR